MGMCMVACLDMGRILLKYEQNVASALLCHTSWGCTVRGQAFAEEFCESFLPSLVTKKGQNKGVVRIEDIGDLHQVISIGKGGQTANVCKLPNPLVTPVR